jgi:hypothetical protein
MRKLKTPLSGHASHLQLKRRRRADVDRRPVRPSMDTFSRNNHEGGPVRDSTASPARHELTASRPKSQAHSAAAASSDAPIPRLGPDKDAKARRWNPCAWDTPPRGFARHVTQLGCLRFRRSFSALLRPKARPCLCLSGKREALY